MQSILEGFARANSLPTAGAVALLGITFHLAIQKVEFEQYLLQFIGSCCALFPLLVGLFIRFGNHTFSFALLRSLLVTIAFHTSLLSSIVLYRIFLHRCRGFPGPVGSRLSRLYTAYLASKKVQYNKELDKMLSQYGDFVRTGPREITILRDSAVGILYGPNSKCLKSSWYGQTGNDPTKVNVHMTRDPKAHSIRRRAWDRGLSVKALATYESRIKSKADLLTYQLEQREGTAVNITDWSMFFAFDLLGEIGFSKDFGQLATGIEHHAIKPIHHHIKLLGIFQTVPWLLYLLGSIPGAAAAYSDIFRFCANEIRSKRKAWDREEHPSDISSWLIKAVEEKDVSASPSAEALDDDARVILLAGSDTTATTLSHVLFLLVKYPKVQQKLQSLLDEAMPRGSSDWSVERMKSITFLDDLVSETLRLKPALLLAGPRETPAEGIQIDEVHIPGNTIVLVPTWKIQRDPRYWKEAETFMPERWGERRDEMDTDKSPYLPFLLGANTCPGKNMARLAVRIAASLILLKFDVAFAPGETGERFDKEELDTFVVTLPPLQLRFTSRSA